jgi:hypothetical protein
LSKNISAGLGISPAELNTKIEAGHLWNSKERKVFRQRAPKVVDSLQLRELKNTIKALRECLSPAKKYYILIDDLDRDLAGNENIQYGLIRALIESLQTFGRIPNLKIVVALREDLLEATLRDTEDAHFQAEKIQGQIRRVKWGRNQLYTIIEKRVQELFRYHYTKQNVKIEEVLPERVSSRKPVDEYLIEHTLHRPRDIIAFVNKILAQNEGATLPLSARAVTRTEPSYSTDRLDALRYEWRSVHPLFSEYVSCLRGVQWGGKISLLTEERLEYIILHSLDLERAPVDRVERLAKLVYERNKQAQLSKLRRAVITVLYKMGVIGVKIEPTHQLVHCYEDRASITENELTDATQFSIHPMFASALGVRPKKSGATTQPLHVE